MFRLLISLWSIFTSLLVCSRAVGLGNLSILLIVSDSARFNTSGAAIGFDLALNRINREPSLLSGYDLTVSSIVDDKVCYFLNSWPTRLLFVPYIQCQTLFTVATGQRTNLCISLQKNEVGNSHHFATGVTPKLIGDLVWLLQQNGVKFQVHFFALFSPVNLLDRLAKLHYYIVCYEGNLVSQASEPVVMTWLWPPAEFTSFINSIIILCILD